MKDKNDFIATLISQFPVLKEEILDEDYSFSINLQMGTLKRFVQSAINKGDKETVQDVFSFVESMIGTVTQDVESAIYVAFLSHLDFSKRPTYKRLLKGVLGNGLDIMERYHQEGPKGGAQDFLDSLK